jgi:hypothetical protein
MVNRISDAELDAFIANAATNDVRQSGTVDALSAVAGNNSGSQSAPAKASAAPKKTNDVFTGLAEALNTFQRRLSDPKDPNRKYDVADEYEIVFAPTSLGDASMKRQGTTDKTKTPMQTPTAQAKNPATNSVNNKASTMQVTAGMQIVQFIDQIMRNSTYITDQQLYIVDSTTKEIKPNPNPPGGIVAWYKINVEATQLGYDAKRRDHAYRMRFIITPYAINELPSDWFQNSRYRGSHKSYNYWFTGANKEIINFEQEYNNLYRLIISGLDVPVKQVRTDFRKPDQYRRTFLAASENHAKGADGDVNEPADNAASFLLSPTDQAKVRLRIIGDPAWMQQGEVAEGIDARTFNFDPFNNDGTINYDSQEVVFDISWNQPVDYNFNTGLADSNQVGVSPDGTYGRAQPQFNYTYTAIKCKNILSKGKFEQELEGRLLIEYENSPTPTDAGRPAATVGSAKQPTAAQIRAADSAIAGQIQADTRGSTTGSELGGTNELLLATGSSEPTPPTQPSRPTPLPATPALPSTSDADIAPVIQANYTVPVPIGRLRLNNGRVRDFFESERGSYERALASGATPAPSESQNMAKDQ